MNAEKLFFATDEFTDTACFEKPTYNPHLMTGLTANKMSPVVCSFGAWTHLTLVNASRVLQK